MHNDGKGLVLVLSVGAVVLGTLGCDSSESSGSGGAGANSTSSSSSSSTSVEGGSGGGTTGGGQGGSGGEAGGTVAPPEGYVLVAAGTFQMGSPLDEPYRCGPDCFDVLPVEKLHQVTISRDIWMKETEVTQSEWQAAVGSNPSVFAACGGGCPVENVTWKQVVAYCTLLSQSEGLEICYLQPDGVSAYDMVAANDGLEPQWPAGPACLGYRLPTEAEWEYAARAGTTTPTYVGASTDENLNTMGWWGGNSACSYQGCADDNCLSGAGIGHPAGIQPVRQKAPNAWGLYDTMGNVWEFVWDIFGEYHTDPVTDPTGPWQLAQGYHVARGGAWINGLAELRSAARDGNDCTCDPDNGPGPHTGFRICRTKP